jgi:hypothetical protein
VRKDFFHTVTLAALALAVWACSETTAPADPKGMEPTLPLKTALTTCRVDVRARSLQCDDAQLVSGGTETRQTILVGGQDLFVRLSSSGTSYDSGTGVLRSDITVENLLQQMMGTTDGTTITGVKIFFHSGPTVTGGTGTVTLANADGSGTFTGGGQDYFNYPQILEPNEISSQHEWRFNAPSTVLTFEFSLLVSTDVPDESMSFLDRLWTGTAGTEWANASNWSGGIPADTSTVNIPVPAKITSGNQPVLAADVTIRNLRVAPGSTLDLGLHSLTATGNVDAPGTITNGTVSITGSSRILGGNFDRLSISGDARLQRDTKATGAVVINGSLSVKDKALTIVLQ